MSASGKHSPLVRAAAFFSHRLRHAAPVAFVLCALAFVGLGADPALAADPFGGQINLIDPTPVANQQPAVDGVNFKFSAVTGAIGGYSNHMFLASVATPLRSSQFGAQIDLGIGKYRHDYISAAAGLHLFWRDPGKGMIGIYGDWGYVNPEHAGRVGVEGALYGDRWSLDVFAGVQFGQHVMTEFVDEVDLSYYVTDNFKASIGHRLISRGHVANIGFEFQPETMPGWSIYGEAETGEDGYHGVWAGMRYSFGTGGAKTLIERDRSADPIVRIPRNLASVTQCGDIPDPANYYTSWNGFEFTKSDHLCADRDELNRRGAIIGKM